MAPTSPFAQLTVDEKTLLHLSQFIFSSDDEAPFEATQEGIAEATGISTTHVPRSVQGLKKKGLVQELRLIVSGSDRRRKVYVPTEEGYRRAQELKSRLIDAELIVRDGDGTVHATSLRALHGPTVTVPQVLKVIHDAGMVPVVAKGESRRTSDQASPTAASLYNRIPQVGDFVGRKRELKELQDSLKDPRVRLIVVAGIAGIGKTTFVAKALSRSKREEVFWYRLHEWDTLRNMGFVMGDFLAQLGKPDFKQYMETNKEHDVAEAYDIVQKDLEGLEAVFVLDDFDKAPRSLVGFIRAFLPHLDRFEGIRLIVITRASIPFFSQSDRVEGRVVELNLSGLSQDEAKRLLPGKKDDARIAEVSRITEGHPLLLKLFANLDTDTRIEEQLAHTEGPSRFVAEEILATLSIAEMRALEAACVHRYPIPPEVLFVNDEVDFDVIDALRRKQLLRSVGGRFVEPVDFVREFVYQRLKPETRRAAHASAARALSAADIPGAGWEVPRHLLLAGEPQEAAKATLTIAPDYLAEGKTERLWALLRDLLTAEGVPREEAGQLAELRADLYDRAGDDKKAEEWRKRAKQYRQGRLVTGPQIS